MHGKPTKEGYLMKRGEINRAWKARWFKVDNSNLLYFKKQESSKPAGHVPLSQAVIRKSRANVGEEHCFEIITKSRVYYLLAKSDNELLEWVHVLSSRTLLHKENELLEKVEEMIAREAYKQSLQDEEKILSSFKKRKTSSSTWNIHRINSSSGEMESSRLSRRLRSTGSLQSSFG